MSTMKISKTATVSHMVTTTPSTILAATTDFRVVRILSNRLVFIKVGIAAEADEADSYPIPEMTEVFVNVAANAEVSVVAATGETTGAVWVTEV